MLRFSGKKSSATSRAEKKVTKQREMIPQSTVSSLDKTFGGTTTFSGIGAKSVAHLEIPNETKRLFLDRNPIKTLEDFPFLPELEFLSLKSTNLESFKGFPTIPALTEIDVKGTPLSQNPGFISGLLILVPTLKKINGEIVTRNARKLAESFNGKAPILLRNGWQPTLHAPSEEETEHILNRMFAMKKNAAKSKERTEKQKTNILPHSVKLSDKLDKQISEQEEEIERLKKLIEKMKKVDVTYVPLLSPRKTPRKVETKQQESIELTDSDDELKNGELNESIEEITKDKNNKKI